MTGLLAPPESGNVAMIMGIRAHEILTRRRMVTAKQVDNYITKFNEGTSRGNMCLRFWISATAARSVLCIPEGGARC
jgi:hypothetical protein